MKNSEMMMTFRWCALPLLALLLGGCATPRLKAPEPLRSGLSAQQAFDEFAETGQVQGSEPLPREEAVVEAGSGRFLNERAAGRTLPGPPTDGEVVFNFEGESLQAVIKTILGDLLQQNYVIAPGVGGTVTFSTARPVKADQAMAILEMLLAWNNATLVWGDGRYTVLPVANAIPGNLTPRIGPPESARGYELRAVPLKYISPAEMEKILQPYVRPNAIVRVDNLRSMMILAGTSRELANYLQTIEVFDVDWLAGMSVAIYPVEAVEVAKLLPELEAVFGEGAGTPLAGLFRFMPIERLNAVLVITTQPNYLEEAERWIRRLDRGGAASGARLYVYDVKNVKATDLSENLGQIFGSSAGSAGGSTGVRGGGVAPGLEPVEIRGINDPREQRRQQREEQGLPTEPGAAPRAGQGIALGDTEDVRITAVEESNSLLIRATPSQYEAVLAAIKRLDRVPLQVHIEAQILQVDLTDALQYGVQWFFSGLRPGIGADGQPVTRPGGGTSGASDSLIVRGARMSSAGITWNFVTDSASSILTTLDQVTRTEVLSAPSLVVLNNREAAINVGTQIPVVSNFLDPIGGGTGGVTRGMVQFRDTGVTLTVTPRVNPGGLVFMEISQEDSNPTGDPDSTGNVSVNRRTITTEVAVQSGHTVLLGGLIKQTDGSGSSGAPGLSRIPILGGLFGSRNRRSDRQELLVLITPTVIASGEDAQALTEEYRRRFVGLKPLRSQAEGKR